MTIRKSAFYLGASALLFATSTVAMAQSIDFDNVTASHLDPDDVTTNPVDSALCDGAWVSCTTTSGGAVTFSTTTYSPDGGNRRSEMREFVASNVINDNGGLNGSAIENNFVLDTYTADDVADAAGTNASVVGALSIDALPTSNIDGENSESVIFSQWHGLELGDDKELLMLAYAVPNDSDTIDIRIDHTVVGEDTPSKDYMYVGLDYGEIFQFSSSVNGTSLTVDVHDADGNLLDGLTLDISSSGFEDVILYGKWGAYVGYDEGDSEDDGTAETTYYSQTYSYD